MKKLNSFLSNNAYVASISLFVVALGIDVATFIGGVIHNGFSAFALITLVFELGLHLFLVIALFKKHNKLMNLSMILIKGFDAVLYSLLVGYKIDKYTSNPSTWYIHTYINFISYTVSAILLLAILVLFCASKMTENEKCWKAMKIIMFITIVVMFVCSISEIVNFVKYSSYWFEFLEPVYLLILISGMLIVCHYIENKNERA